MKKLWAILAVFMIAGCAGIALDTEKTERAPVAPSRLFVTSDGILYPVNEEPMRIRTPVIEKSDNYTMTADEMRGSRVVLTGDGKVLTLADSDDCDAGDCIIVEIGDAHDKYIDVSSDDADNFKLNVVDVTASYKIFIDAANEGDEIKICLDVAGSNEWKAYGSLDWEDSGGD